MGSCLFRFDQKKTKNNAFCLCRKKKDTFLTFENRIFQSPRNRTFSKGIIHAFGQKMPIFSLLRFDQNKTRNNAFLICKEKKNLF